MPDSVDSNIPRRSRHSDPGAWTVARGILIELCHILNASPISLLYQELLVRRNRDLIGLRITAHARPRHGHDVIVIYRSESAHRDPSGGRWSITVNGLIPLSRVSITRPSPPWIARLAREALRTHLDS